VIAGHSEGVSGMGWAASAEGAVRCHWPGQQRKGRGETIGKKIWAENENW